MGFAFFFFLISYILSEKVDLDGARNTKIYEVSVMLQNFLARGFCFLLGIKMRVGWLSDVLEEWQYVLVL